MLTMDMIRFDKCGARTGPHGTFGVAVLHDLPRVVTLEPPWADNRPNVSCIPADTYLCKRVVSPKYGNTFEVKDVPGRTHILLHWGNIVLNTDGCILTGRRFGFLGARYGVLDSRAAFKDLMHLLAGVEEFRLAIRWAEGPF